MLSNLFLNGQNNFKPTQAVLKEWLRTEKKSQTTFGVTRLSMFDEPSSAPVYWVMAILLIEAVITFYAMDDGLNYLMVLICMLGDFIFAHFGHVKQDEIVLAKNQLIALSNSNEPAKKDKASRVLGKMERSKFIFYCGIMVLAVIKIGAFFLQNHDDIQSIHFIVLFGYLSAALLHIRFTGYAIGYLRFNSKIKKQYDMYVDDERNSFSYDLKDPLCVFIGTSQTLKTVSTTNHAIVEREDGWYFVCNGILLDIELCDIATKQKTDEDKRKILLLGINIQCNQMSL